MPSHSDRSPATTALSNRIRSGGLGGAERGRRDDEEDRPEDREPLGLLRRDRGGEEVRVAIVSAA
jgi:hypothetical protein